MRIYECRQWLEALDEVIGVCPSLSRLSQKTILITGATGLVCSPVVDLLMRYNDTHSAGIRILIAGRDPKKVMDRFGVISGNGSVRFVPFDAARQEQPLFLSCDYIIHGASNSSPDMIVREPVETMLSNILGLKTLLDCARRCGAARLLYVSSSEVYGQKETSKPYSEDQYGYIDLLNPRSSYSMGKRAAETLCASYEAEYGVKSVIVRPGHIYGPTASLTDRHVASVWACAAARGEDLVMKSDGAQIRSYCHCLDCASAILTVLLCGESGSAYNISNPDSVISIRQMAEYLSRAGGVRLEIQAPSQDEKKAFNPMMNSSLESGKLQALGWTCRFGAERGFTDTLAVLKAMLRDESPASPVQS